MRIDSHHHLWHFDQENFGWVPESMAVLRRDFLLPELTAEAARAGVDGTVVVQARQDVDETLWLLRQAEKGPIAGVVGWAPIASSQFGEVLESLTGFKALKGLRHIVQAEPDGFLAQPQFSEGMRRITAAGLVYDLLVYSRQLPFATEFVDRHPSQVFVLDHIGKPDILHSGFESWSVAIRELARRPHVRCKVSGLVTEADLKHWTPGQLQPYLELVLEAFGPDRLMVGTDWPVCTAACSYGQWWQVMEEWTAALSQSEREAIFGGTAIEVYSLDGHLQASQGRGPGVQA